MCGIAGTVYNREILPGIEIQPENLQEILKNIKNGNDNSANLLDAAWKYKSNINFLRFVKDNKEKNAIDEVVLSINLLSESIKNKIPNIDKSVSYDEYNNFVQDYQNLLDASWFLSVEINRWLEIIEYLSGKSISSLSDQAIILYKDITKVINAIDNRLELRGRDSFGLSITLNSKNFNGDDKCNHNFKDNEESHHFYKISDIGSHNFSFKSCNSIGALGENASDIKYLIKSNSFFNSLIQSNKVDSSTIMAHTRWASVGKVNIHNTHPVEYIDGKDNINAPKISSILNGDIYNYKDIISESIKRGEFSLDTSLITNDCVAIPAFLRGNKDIGHDTFSSMASKFSGSYVISVQHSMKPEDIFIVKKGIQGLYLGYSYDGVMFASDVYGLVETCRYFVPIESDKSFFLSSSNIISYNKSCIDLRDQKTNELSVINSEDLRVSNITTRDIDKKGYEHFLEKEIHETPDIISRTLTNYLQPADVVNENTISDAVAISQDQIPEYIIESLRNKEINKIILTGMGTCYTAAVAISMYMRSRLKIFIPYILVEPHIATEGSAFYLEPNMQDTLVIVIAQSGTTVDTNVYVQKAKDRGAMSLAIANKREGDVTFIVDGTLYIGDGRDIEIAVPSTKTYSAQVTLGYILTLALTTKIVEKKEDKDLLLRDLENLRLMDTLIDRSFETLKNEQLFENIALQGCRHNSWYMLRDNTSNSVCADEIRIKYSENCYQSVSSLSLSEVDALSIKNSFLVIITESEISSIDKELDKFIKANNYVVIIANGVKNLDSYQDKIDSKKLSIINMPKADKYFTFLPTILAGQVLSYYQAMSLDKRKHYFINLEHSLTDRDSFNKEWDRLRLSLKEKNFYQGFSESDFKKLNSYTHKYISEEFKKDNSIKDLKNLLNKMSLDSRRTIDTIKHQAKTITVGAVREEASSLSFSDSNVFLIDDNANSEDYSNLIERINNSFKLNNHSLANMISSKYGEVLIAFEGTDESFAYNISNIINDFGNQFSISPKVRLARPYDYPTESKKSGAFWIVLSDSDFNEKIFLDEDQYILFDFSLWDQSSNFSDDFLINSSNGDEYKKSMWSLFIGIYLANQWLIPSFFDIKKNQSQFKKMNFEITRQLNILIDAVHHISSSKNLELSIEYAVNVFLSRINWKSIGSGMNFNISKHASKRLIKEANRACAFDVLENHKHIDISAESAILVFIGNIWKHGYQEDVFSELEKLVAHNNIPIVITNDGDERFDSMSLHSSGDFNVVNIDVPVIKIPKVGIQYSFPINVLVIEKFIMKIADQDNKNRENSDFSAALRPPIMELLDANIWK